MVGCGGSWLEGLTFPVATAVSRAWELVPRGVSDGIGDANDMGGCWLRFLVSLLLGGVVIGFAVARTISSMRSADGWPETASIESSGIVFVLAPGIETTPFVLEFVYDPETISWVGVVSFSWAPLQAIGRKACPEQVE